MLVSVPHSGTHVPEAISADMTEAGRAVPDTDWHVDRLYDFLDELGASVLVATHSRYVIDLNRPPDGHNLYPGRDTPGLVPLRTFDGEPIYQNGREPTESVAHGRRARYWQPYHDHLEATLAQLRQRHGFALLWDAHSIRTEVPRLFDGRLPDLNLGTAAGAACAAPIAARLLGIARQADSYSAVLDGRFRGGYITRHYGDPARAVHAVQLEIAQSAYMEEPAPHTFRDDLAARLTPTLRHLIAAFLADPDAPS